MRTAASRSLLLLDVQIAELVYVLEKLYSVARRDVATYVGAALGLKAIIVDNEEVLRRTLTLYEQFGMHWADAYMISSAEDRKLTSVVSFDKFDAKLRGLPVQRREP